MNTAHKVTLSMFIFLFSAFIQVQAKCFQPIIYDQEIRLTKTFFTIGTKFAIESNQYELGRIKKNFMNLRPTYTWESSDGEVIAWASIDFFSIGTSISVYDCHNKQIGTIKENFFQLSLFRKTKNYTIQDESGNLIAESKKTELLATQIDLSKDGYQLATVTRPWISLRESWVIHNIKPGSIDARILLMIGVFKSDADLTKKREQAQAEEEAKKKK